MTYLEKNMIISVREYEKIIFFEEGIISGGIGEHFIKELLEYGFKGEYHVKGISKFIKQSSVKSALDKLGFDCDSMASYIREIMEE